MLKFYTCTLSQSGVRFFSKPLLFSNVVHFLRCLPINDILKFFYILMHNYVTYVGFAKIGHGNHRVMIRIKIFKIFPMTFSFFPTEKITVYSAWTCFRNVISKTHMWPSRNGLDWTERYLFQETSDNNLRKLWGKSIELFEN